MLNFPLNLEMNKVNFLAQKNGYSILISSNNINILMIYSELLIFLFPYI